jgi:hypothetical protein
MKVVFKNLKIARKIGVVFLLLFLMMGIGGSVGLYNASQILKVASFLYEDNFKGTETMNSSST